MGIYQFFQDSSFLASNIANVAMLWAFYLWIIDRRFWSAFCFGVAGLSHLNYAIVGVGVGGTQRLGLDHPAAADQGEYRIAGRAAGCGAGSPAAPRQPPRLDRRHRAEHSQHRDGRCTCSFVAAEKCPWLNS